METKICKICLVNKELSLDNYTRNNQKLDKFSNTCKNCVSLKLNSRPYRKKEISIEYEDGTKYCNGCKEIKDLACFPKPKFKSDNLKVASQCKDCAHITKIKKKYGISKEDYLLKISIQNNLCKICGNPETELSRLSVDHNHETGKVRDLLCNKCNVGLGQFKDNSELLIKASEYLRSHK